MSDFENKTFSLRFEPGNRAVVIKGYIADVEIEKTTYICLWIWIIYGI